MDGSLGRSRGEQREVRADDEALQGEKCWHRKDKYRGKAINDRKALCEQRNDKEEKRQGKKVCVSFLGVGLEVAVL